MKSLSYVLLDVFTDTPFGGNPLAVFPHADGLETELMQRIANELNLSETTFIQQPVNSQSDCRVRIFTPQTELPMAGHPTIGTAYALLSHGWLEPTHSDHLVFDEGVGPVRVDYTLDEGRPAGLLMHQLVPEHIRTLDHETLARILSLAPEQLRADLPIQVLSSGVPFILVPLKNLEALEQAAVRLDLLEQLRDAGSREIIVFTLETEEADVDVRCRMFAPMLGVLEDPATGSAHGPLGAYLVENGLLEPGRIMSSQGVEMGRPSKLTMIVDKEKTHITGVAVGGECLKMGQGSLTIPVRQFHARPGTK